MYYSVLSNVNNNNNIKQKHWTLFLKTHENFFSPPKNFEEMYNIQYIYIYIIARLINRFGLKNSHINIEKSKIIKKYTLQTPNQIDQLIYSVPFHTYIYNFPLAFYIFSLIFMSPYFLCLPIWEPKIEYVGIIRTKEYTIFIWRTVCINRPSYNYNQKYAINCCSDN